MAKTPMRAAQYLRMSREAQRYSIEFQTATNLAYAEARGIEIVQTYADRGISGLRLKKRDGLKGLLADVLGGQPGFDKVLVYDVSRWGRFQDVDEAAHYEFLCRSAGVAIEYTAESFANDGSMAASLLKHMRRIMAAEYSRDLSDKVSGCQRGLAAQGFWQGGPPGYGFRRMALRRTRAPERLEAGEYNGIRGDRITLVAGPDEEVAVVRRMFEMAAVGMGARPIADVLTAEGLPSPSGKTWEQTTVSSILRNEKYVGVNVVGRRRSNLGRHMAQPRETWIRVPDAFEPLVSRELFDRANRRRTAKLPTADDETLLANLAAALADAGYLSFEVIRKDPRTHAPSVYGARFGSLAAAYALIGYEPTRQQRLAAERAKLHKPHLYRTFGRAPAT